MATEISDLEQEIFELTAKLNELRKASPGTEVRNYSFRTLDGDATLLELFGDNDRLLAIHNMGQGCRYCTLWAEASMGLFRILNPLCQSYWCRKIRLKCNGTTQTAGTGDSGLPRMAAATT